MGTTATYTFPYPEPTDAPDGPAQIAALANAVEAVLAGIFPVGFGAWATWTPTFRQGANAVAHTVEAARYMRVGRLVVAKASLTVTGTGTASQPLYVTPPVTPAATGIGHLPIGTGFLSDSSAGGNGVYRAFVTATPGSNLFGFFAAHTQSWSDLGVNGFTDALANGDNLRFTAIYEAAA